MLEHAAQAALYPVQAEQSPNNFTCDFCDFSTSLPNGLKIHMGIKHKEHQMPEVWSNKSGKSAKATVKCPASLKLFVSEHNQWYHVYGYGGPEEQPKGMGIYSDFT